MDIRMLGSLEVDDDYGRPVPIRGTYATRLIIALALRPGQVISDDRLVEILWGEEPPARAANALQRHMSTLRNLLGRHDVIARRGNGYVLLVDATAVDLSRFESLAARGREAAVTGDRERAIASFDEALALWRGDALADVADELFALTDRTRLAELRMTTLEARIDMQLALGHHASVIPELEQLVMEHPFREHVRAQLMLAMSRAGRQTEALRSYRAARALLAEEVGLEPSPELRQLETAILQHDESTTRPGVRTPLTSRTTRLRTPLTSLIGRGDELDGLVLLLRSHRLVTLVGPGGVGKTRLAIEAARVIAGGERINVGLVELADVTDPDGVVAAIGAAIEAPVAPEASADLARLAEHVCDRKTLIVLDNCEHLLSPAARAAQDLLELCPNLTVLATSREDLAIPGEVVRPVPPLAVEDAVALFVERGRAAAPAALLATDSADVRAQLQSICMRLDGLPLAIELAAPRLRVMPLNELALGLTDRFRLLTRGARTARPRQQTLRAAIDWSYDLLFDDERRVLARLSVFTGGCSLDAARAVCADDSITPDDVGDLLVHLADKSLLTIEDDGDGTEVRCRMLQTLIEYGRERLLAAGEADRVRGVYARYYRELATGSVAALRGEQQSAWLHAIGSNMGNLRAVLDGAVSSADAELAQEIAGSLGWYWWFTGRASEGARWLALARSAGHASRDTTTARLQAWTAFMRTPGFVLWSDEDATQLVSAAGEDHDRTAANAVAVLRASGALDEVIGIETALAVASSSAGSHERAAALLADAEQALADLEPVAWVRAMQAFVFARRAFVENRYDDAEEWFRASLPLLSGIGAEVHCSFALRYLGRLLVLRGEHDASIDAIESAQALAQRMGLAGFTTVLLTDLAACLASRGDFDAARRHLEQPLAAARENRSVAGIAEALTALAWVEWHAGNSARATKLAAEAHDKAASSGLIEAAFQSSAILGATAARRGDRTEAWARRCDVLEIACRTDEPRRLALALEGFADLVVADDGWAAARFVGAAAALRQSPGRASGWAFAAQARLATDEILASATEAIGAAAVAGAVEAGAADPPAALAALHSVYAV